MGGAKNRRGRSFPLDGFELDVLRLSTTRLRNAPFAHGCTLPCAQCQSVIGVSTDSPRTERYDLSSMIPISTVVALHRLTQDGFLCSTKSHGSLTLGAAKRPFFDGLSMTIIVGF